MNWQLFTNVLGLAIGAGLNLYAAVLVTGLGIRFGWLSELPGDLQILAHPAVLIAAGVMYIAEFAADKIPFFTPIWDGIHTFIRPIGGALLALSATADLDPMAKVMAMLAAGTLTLGAHSSKMGFRLLAHTAPEPATHSVISIVEDISVAALLLLAFKFWHIALPVLLIVLIGIALFLPLLFRIARFLLSCFGGMLRSLFTKTPGDAAPDWVPDRAGAVRVLVRRLKGAPYMTKGWLNPRTGEFHQRRWGGVKTFPLGTVEPTLDWGILCHVARTSGGASFYVTKEWCHSFQTAPAGPATA
jgi:hypothetical protein